MYVVLSIRAYVENMDQVKLLFLIAICKYVPEVISNELQTPTATLYKKFGGAWKMFYYFIWKPRYVGPVILNVNLFALRFFLI